MSDLNAHSDRMVLIIGCSVKNTNEFKNGLKTAQLNMFTTSRNKTVLVMNGTYLKTALRRL